MTINGTHGVLHYGLLPEPGKELIAREILQQYCGQQPRPRGEVPITYYESPKEVVLARVGLASEGSLDFEPFLEYRRAAVVSPK